MIETGTWDKMYGLWFEREEAILARCNNPIIRTLGFEVTGSLILMLTIGIAVSLIIMVFEIVYKKCMTKRSLPPS